MHLKPNSQPQEQILVKLKDSGYSVSAGLVAQRQNRCQVDVWQFRFYTTLD